MTTPGKNPDPLSRLITEGQPKTPLPPLSDDGGGPPARAVFRIGTKTWCGRAMPLPVRPL